MPLTEPERNELTRLAHDQLGERLAELLMRSIPTEPDRFATKDDLARTEANLRVDMADLRTDMADLRTDMADLRTELTQTVSAAITGQTRTLLMGLVVAIVASNVATILG